MTCRYTLRDLVTLLARLAKPITDALAAEFPASSTPTPAFTPNPGRKVVGAVAAVEPTAAEPSPFVPAPAAALSIPAATVPSMAPWLDVAPIAQKPARKVTTRKPA